MKKINLLIIAISMIFMVSCEGFLDVAPTNQADSSTAITSTSDAQVMLNGIMRKLTSSSFYGRNFILYGDAKGGDWTIESQGRGYDQLFSYKHTVNSGTYSGFWTQGFNILLQTNNLIDAADRLAEEGVDISSYKAQALTIRAMVHFDLCRLYGQPYNMNKSAWGIPIANEIIPAGDKRLRNTVEEVYAQVIKDLDESASGLSKSKSKGYVNYWANRAIKARVLMHMDNYSGALALAEEVINGGVYKLYSNADWAASWESQWGTESILELGMYDNEGDLGTGSLGAMIVPQGVASSSPQYFMASTPFLNLLGEDPDDVRWGVMGVDEMDVRPGGLGSCYKYLGGLGLKGDGKASTTAVNIKLIRLSEMYLLAAEAAVLSGNNAKAAEYLNAIRKRSPNLAPATSADVTQDMILDEMSKEFFAEGHRFFDLIRANKTIKFDDETSDLPKLEYRDHEVTRTNFRCILPIFQDEINVNPDIQQNPGY